MSFIWRVQQLFHQVWRIQLANFSEEEEEKLKNEGEDKEAEEEKKIINEFQVV